MDSPYKEKQRRLSFKNEANTDSYPAGFLHFREQLFPDEGDVAF